MVTVQPLLNVWKPRKPLTLLSLVQLELNWSSIGRMSSDRRPLLQNDVKSGSPPPPPWWNAHII